MQAIVATSLPETSATISFAEDSYPLMAETAGSTGSAPPVAAIMRRDPDEPPRFRETLELP